MPPLGTPLTHTKFNLNTAGVAGFFGGDEAISAMNTVHLYSGRRWLGWFNSPGSYTIAKRFGRMANSTLWDGLFPGPNDSPAVSFGLDGKQGPQYIAPLSGTTLTTGHLGYLAMKRSKEGDITRIKGRMTTPMNVAYLAMQHVDEARAEIKPLPVGSALWGLVPIFISLTTCIMCALVYDWFSFSMILLGIVSSGLASLVIGKGRLVIESVWKPGEGAPPGHGILIGEHGMVVIKGAERDVNVITKGRFNLITAMKQRDAEVNRAEVGSAGVNRAEVNTAVENTAEENAKEENRAEQPENRAEENKDNAPKYHAIGLSALLLLVQFLLQLLLIPQGSLFGQIMFLVSLGASWVYNSYLSSLEEEKIQENLLFDALGESKMLRFRIGTRTTMAVFVCLLLFHRVECTTEKEERVRAKILDACVPNDTAVWTLWKEKVVQHLLDIKNNPNAVPSFAEDMRDETFAEFPAHQRLFRRLLVDARNAFEEYIRFRDRLPPDSSLTQ